MAAWLMESMQARADQAAIHDPLGAYTYASLVADIGRWRDGLLRQLQPGSVVAFDGDYGRGAVSLMVALVMDGQVAVPVSRETAAAHGELMTLAGAGYYIADPDTVPRLDTLDPVPPHAYYQTLRQRRHPGLVLFTSGSTGAPKGAVHDIEVLLRKFQVPRQAYRTLAFLQLDHIGGLNTLFYTLANGGTLVFATERAPAQVCDAIERHRCARASVPTCPPGCGQRYWPRTGRSGSIRAASGWRPTSRECRCQARPRVGTTAAAAARSCRPGRSGSAAAGS
jgi:acyl-CoA synthetase (AMP-forming)/AMP-acid ligase II